MQSRRTTSTNPEILFSTSFLVLAVSSLLAWYFDNGTWFSLLLLCSYS